MNMGCGNSFRDGTADWAGGIVPINTDFGPDGTSDGAGVITPATDPVTVTCTLPTLRANGDPLDVSEIAYIENMLDGEILPPAPGCRLITSKLNPGAHTFRGRAVDTDGLVAEWTDEQEHIIP